MSNKTTRRRMPRTGPTPVGERLRASTIPAVRQYDIPWTPEEWVAWEEDDDTCPGCYHVKHWCRCDQDVSW